MFFKYKKALVVLFLIAATSHVFSQIKGSTSSSTVSKSPPVEVVFVVDVSSSTGGILTSMKLNFWEIINEMNRLRPVPTFKLGLILMGRPSFGKENGYVKVASNLTDDIDFVANELFSLKELSAKGSVLMGDAIHTVVTEIKWSKEPNTAKMVFLVGNGGVYNGYNILKACEVAKQNKIRLYSLYFKTYDNKKEVEGWKEIARLTDGEFFTIGLKEPGIVFEKPYDNDLLLEASAMITKTYIPYGKDGLARQKAQQMLDDEAKKINETANEARAFFKATSLYQEKNGSWDVVDMMFTSQNKVNLSSLKKDQLEPHVSKMTEKQFSEYVAQKSQERVEYINILKMLSTKREEFMKMKKKTMEQYRFGDTFFGVVNRVMVKNCKEKGYVLDY